MTSHTIGHKTGARINFFKTKEGKPGDGVCALYDIPWSNLRLYCIRYANSIVIVGSGGHKPKNTRALQETPKLKDTNELMVSLSAAMSARIKEKQITYSPDYQYFEGELEFDIELN